MTKHKILAGAAFAALALAGTAHAETTFSGNVALTTDYQFRGLSQTDEDPAIQGGFDAANGMFYAGAWGSSIDFAPQSAELELDVYAGVKPTYGPLNFDFGVIGYLYPGASDDTSELDYWELKAGVSGTPVENLTLGATVNYSPDFTLDGGDAVYVEGAGALKVSDMVSLSAGVGHQDVSAKNYYVDGASFTDNYTTWNVGGTVNWEGFGFDLRYVDTNLDTPISDSRVTFAVKRAL